MNDDARRAAPLLAGSVVFFCAVFSGGTYQWSRDFFVFASAALFVLAAGSGASPFRLWPLWILPGLALFSAAWTVNLNNTLSAVFYLAALAFFACFASYAGRDGRARVLSFLLAAAAAVSLYAVYQYFIGLPRTEEYLMRAGGADSRAMALIRYRRAFSTMLSPNVLAGWLAVVFPAALSLAVGDRNRRALWLLLSALMFFALLLTKSAGGFIAFAVGVVVFGAVTLARGRRGAKTALVAAAALAALIASGYGIYAKRSGGALGVGTSLTQRIDYWGAAYGIYKESPVIGQGAGSFGILYPAHKRPGMDETRYAHNIFLHYAAEGGAVGLAALLVVFAAFFYYCVRALPGDAEGVVPGLIAGGAAFIAHNLVDFTFFVPETAVVFWLYFGLASSGAEPGGGRLAKAWMAAGIILAAAVLFFYGSSYLAEQKKRDALEMLRLSGITSSAAARSNPAPAEAVAQAESAVSLKPYDDGLHTFLGGLYEGRALADGPASAARAGEQYKKAVALNPKYPFHYRDLGILYMKMGDRARAIEQFRQAVERYPASGALGKYLEEAEKAGGNGG